VTFSNLTVMSIAAFDGLAITAALGAIAEDLGHVSLLPWVITAYLAASAVAVIVAGPVIDAIGVRRTFRITGLWFLVWSAAAAFAPSMPVLIAARALQGVGGGLVMAVAIASIGLTFPSALRPRALAANSMVWGVMGFGGPAIAGALLAIGDWESIFLFQLPITGLALVIGWNTLPEARPDAVRAHFDRGGVALLSAVTLASLVAVSEIGDRWDVVAAGMLVSALAGAGYWVHAGRAAEPVLARRHIVGFPNWAVHAVVAITFTSGLAIDNYLPIYSQVNRGLGESAAAFTLAFLAVGWTMGSVLYSRLFVNVRPPVLMVWGTSLLATACLVTAIAVSRDWHLGAVLATYAFVGLGIGTVSTSSLNWLQASTDPVEMGRANSAHQFLRQLAITYGVAVGGAVLLFVVAGRIDDVDVVRDALAGEDVELGAEAGSAIGAGLAAVAVMSAALAAFGALVAAMVLRRGGRAEANSRLVKSDLAP
jgi:MFS family permease